MLQCHPGSTCYIFCGRLDFVKTFHLRKLQFIRRISSFDSCSVMTECISYYSLSKEFKDMVSVYSIDFMKLSYMFRHSGGCFRCFC